jgi:cytochrome P450
VVSGIDAPPLLDGFDPLSQEFLADPTPWFERARSEGLPVFYVPSLGLWVLTRYEDVAAAFADFETFSSELSNEPAIPDRYVDRVPADFFPPTNMSKDPPDHTAMRKAANRLFTRPRIAAMEDHVTDIVDELIDRFADAGHCDVVEDLSYPLSARTSMNLIGIPEADLARFEQLADDLVTILPYRAGEPEANSITEEDWLRRWDRIVDARAYFGEYVESRKKSPGEDLASALLGAKGKDGRRVLSDEEIVTNMLLFIFAGTDTTASFIGLLLMQLASNPDQEKMLRADRSLWPGAVEEGLRRRASSLGISRRTTREVEVSGVTLPAGSTVLLSTVSASNDGDHFPEPTRFDLTRSNASDHLAFGRGRHFCMGAPLARLETPIAIQRLWDRLPGFHLVPDQDLRFDPVFVTLLYHHLSAEWDAGGEML